MSKRLVDGEAIWSSEKLLNVPAELRAEYTWVLPLAEANGCAEYNPAMIWRNCYALTREGWTPARVEELFTAFEQAKMVFRFRAKYEPADKERAWVFFIGVEKRLPPQSERNMGKFKFSKSIVPAKELAVFLNEDIKTVATCYQAVLSPASIGCVSQDNAVVYVADNALVHVAGENNEKVEVENHVEANGSFAAAADTGSSHPPNSLSSSQQGQSKSSKAPATSAPRNAPTPLKVAAAAERYAEMWYAASFQNGFADVNKHPKKWADLWESDFLELMQTYTPEQVLNMMMWSQTDAQQKYYVRPDGLKKNAKIAWSNTERLKKDAKKWDVVVENWEFNLTTGRSLREAYEKEQDDDNL